MSSRAVRAMRGWCRSGPLFHVESACTPSCPPGIAPVNKATTGAQEEHRGQTRPRHRPQPGTVGANGRCWIRTRPGFHGGNAEFAFCRCRRRYHGPLLPRIDADPPMPHPGPRANLVPKICWHRAPRPRESCPKTLHRSPDPSSYPVETLIAPQWGPDAPSLDGGDGRMRGRFAPGNAT